MVMLRSGFFWSFVINYYAPERKFRAENGGLSIARHIPNMHNYNGSAPPPPARGGGGGGNRQKICRDSQV